jgi:hypothetical protein
MDDFCRKPFIRPTNDQQRQRFMLWDQFHWKWPALGMVAEYCWGLKSGIGTSVAFVISRRFYLWLTDCLDVNWPRELAFPQSLGCTRTTHRRIEI